jgi:hypothetical protein
MDLAGGTLKFKAPEQAMYSVDTGWNRILWVIRVAGKNSLGWTSQVEYPVLLGR